MSVKLFWLYDVRISPWYIFSAASRPDSNERRKVIEWQRTRCPKKSFLLNEQDQWQSSELCSNFWCRSIYVALHFALWPYCIMTTVLIALRKPRNLDWYKTVGILWLRTLLHRPEIDGSLAATNHFIFDSSPTCKRSKRGDDL